MIQQSPTERLDGNDIWEALFGIMRGNVPDELTEAVCQQLADALASQAAQPAEADGWVMVPRIMTDAMLAAAASAVGDERLPGYDADAAQFWAAALAATPKAPTSTAGEVEPVCAQCKGMIGDLPSGRDPEEFCDTCYEDAVASLATPKAPATDAGEVVGHLRDADTRWLQGAQYATLPKGERNGFRDELERRAVAIEAGAPGLDVDGMCNDHGVFGCKRCLATPPAPNDDLRAALESFVAALTSNGQNEATCLTFNHDALRELVDNARAALKENRRG